MVASGDVPVDFDLKTNKRVKVKYWNLLVGPGSSILYGHEAIKGNTQPTGCMPMQMNAIRLNRGNPELAEYT